MRRILISAMTTLILSVPHLVVAAGLVPCGGAGEPACQACHVRLLAQNVMEWLIVVMGLVAVLIIVVAGIYLASSRGNPAAAQWAKRKIYNALFGYAILLASWQLIDVLLKIGVDQTSFGVWNNIVCVR